MIRYFLSGSKTGAGPRFSRSACGEHLGFSSRLFVPSSSSSVSEYLIIVCRPYADLQRSDEPSAVGLGGSVDATRTRLSKAQKKALKARRGAPRSELAPGIPQLRVSANSESEDVIPLSSLSQCAVHVLLQVFFDGGEAREYVEVLSSADRLESLYQSVCSI